MIQNKQNNKAFTWAVRFAWLFGLAGIAGVMYVLFTNEDYNGMGGNKIDTSLITHTTVSSGDSQHIADNNVTPVNTGTASPKHEPKPEAAAVKTVTNTPPVEKPKEKIAEKPIVKIQPPAVKPQPPIVKQQPVIKPQPQIVKTPPKILPIPVEKTKPLVKNEQIKPLRNEQKIKPGKLVEDKVMSEDELSQLTARIIKTGEENGMHTKCVQLHNTNDGNNKRAIQQIESYLRSQKFSIAGRETESTHIKGIKVSTGSSCMKILVGSL